MNISLEPVSILASRLGLPGFTALALLAWAAWTQWVAAPAAERAATELHQNVVEAASRKTPPPTVTPQAVLARIYADLPDDQASNPTLAAILERARAQGLLIEAVQFQTESVRLPGVRHHRASLPVRGRYDVLRGWIAQTLHDHPSVTLDAIELKRKDADSDQLEAHMVLSLWASERPQGRTNPGEGGHGY